MAAATPEAHGVKSLVVRCRKLFQLLSRFDHLPLGGLEGPLLLVGKGFIDNEAQRKDGSQHIDSAERDSGVHAHQRREGGHEHQRILVDADEKEVEQGPGQSAPLERRTAAYYTPAVVLFPFPEFELISTLAGEVEGEAGAPQRGQDSHHHQPEAHSPVDGDDPGVGDGKQAPELVHLAVVPGEFAHHEAPGGAAEGDDAQGFQHLQLLGVQRRAHIDIQ